MLTPSLQEFVEMAQRGHRVPLRRRIAADLETPVSVFLKLQTSGAVFLLESVERGIQVGRYSFIGLSPFTTLKLQSGIVHIHRNGESEEVVVGDRDPLSFIRDELARSPIQLAEDIPGPTGGAVGFLSYEMSRYFERLPESPRGELDLPDYSFVFPAALVIFDHVKSEIEIVSMPHGEDASAAFKEAERATDAIYEALCEPLDPAVGREASASPTRSLETPNMTQKDFEQIVSRAKDYIHDGDAFQIVLSQRIEGSTEVDPFQIYRALRILNPSPYMFFIDFEDFQLVGSSPEALVKLDKRTASVSPIAGTRPRGANPGEDQALEQELKSNEKERAEHVMLVDLGRNDLGRVCEPGSVRTESFMQVEKYSHVMHLVSRVTGTLLPNLDSFDLVRAAFPAGTLTGAPKIRAMEIIAELEGEKRGPYGGAVGYFTPQGDADLCITIRTIIMARSRYYVQGGAGIVADSDPAAEYRETLNKIQALRKAIEMAERGR